MQSGSQRLRWIEVEPVEGGRLCSVSWSAAGLPAGGFIEADSDIISGSLGQSDLLTSEESHPASFIAHRQVWSSPCGML